MPPLPPPPGSAAPVHCNNVSQFPQGLMQQSEQVESLPVLIVALSPATIRTGRVPTCSDCCIEPWGNQETLFTVEKMYFHFQTLAYDPDIEDEREEMKDDAIKWALAFMIMGVGTGLGIFFQVSL